MVVSSALKSRISSIFSTTAFVAEGSVGMLQKWALSSVFGLTETSLDDSLNSFIELLPAWLHLHESDT